MNQIEKRLKERFEFELERLRLETLTLQDVKEGKIVFDEKSGKFVSADFDHKKSKKK